jgi:hypothetical protein
VALRRCTSLTRSSHGDTVRRSGWHRATRGARGAFNNLVVVRSVVVESSEETAECDPGTLVTFDPGEEHRVRALADARLLLVLAPWPAAEHYTDAEQHRGDHLPANAVVDPLPASETATGPANGAGAVYPGR